MTEVPQLAYERPLIGVVGVYAKEVIWIVAEEKSFAIPGREAGPPIDPSLLSYRRHSYHAPCDTTPLLVEEEYVQVPDIGDLDAGGAGSPKLHRGATGLRVDALMVLLVNPAKNFGADLWWRQ
jgi:hypothetical protein